MTVQENLFYQADFLIEQGKLYEKELHNIETIKNALSNQFGDAIKIPFLSPASVKTFWATVAQSMANACLNDDGSISNLGMTAVMAFAEELSENYDTIKYQKTQISNFSK